MKKLVAVGMVGLMLSASGCYSTYIVPKSELTHLDGYDVHNFKTAVAVGGYGESAVMIAPDKPHRVLSTDGKAIDYGPGMDLNLVAYDQPTGPGGKFSEIHVTDAEFDGKLMNGESIKEKLADVNHVEITTENRTGSYLLGATVGTLVVGALIVGVAAASK